MHLLINRHAHQQTVALSLLPVVISGCLQLLQCMFDSNGFLTKWIYTYFFSHRLKIFELICMCLEVSGSLRSCAETFGLHRLCKRFGTKCALRSFAHSHHIS